MNGFGFKVTIIFLIFPLLPTGCKSNHVSTVAMEENSGESILIRPLLSLIRHHRDYSTHIDGPSCPMYPSCSAYGERAVREDQLLGLLLLVDRLFYRETGNLARKYMVAPSYLSDAMRFFDPYDDSPGNRTGPSLLTEEFR